MATFWRECQSFLVLITSFYIISFMQVQGAVSESESTMTWQSYWEKKLPLVPAPASLASLASTMSAEEATIYVGKIRQGSVDTKASLCRPKTMLCGQSAASTPTVCINSFLYKYASARCTGHTEMQEGLFFRPEELAKGTTLLYPALANNVQGRTFLPAQLAAAMPFKRDRLATYISLLEVPRASNMAASMDNTLAFCNSKPADEEVHSCHSSIESMTDFATAQLGSHVAARSLNYSPSKSEEVHVARQVTLSTATSASVTCHDLMFPYLVYGCHVMRATNVYDVELEKANGSRFRGIAVCHADTRAWNSDHPAFASLNAKPGDGAICHWLPQNNFLWVKS